jgi:septum site-determining protein MinD
MKYRRMMVTSRKGGVGKSTVSANLAFAFARLGLRTMVVDLDLSNRSLDLFLGCEDSVIYDLSDLLSDRASIEDVVLSSQKAENLYFLPGIFDISALSDDERVTSERLEDVVARAEEFFSLDLVIIDTSGSADDSTNIAYPICDTAVIVTNQTEVSIRAAEATGYSLSQKERKDLWLVINNFETDIKREPKATALEIIDRTRLPIMGIVPHDERLCESQEKGLLVHENKKSGNATASFDNIASRFMGRRVPLFSGLSHIKKKKLLSPKG